MIMDCNRIKLLFHKLCFVLIVDGNARGNYLKKHNLLKRCGENLLFQSRNFPMDPELLSIHDNVSIAANVTFVTHDAIRHMLCYRDKYPYIPHMGCIEIMDNVFVGIGAIVMPNVRIGANSIVAAGALVTKDIPSGEIWGGVPARKIGTTEELTNQRKLESEKKPQGFTQDECWKQFYATRR